MGSGKSSPQPVHERTEDLTGQNFAGAAAAFASADGPIFQGDALSRGTMNRAVMQEGCHMKSGQKEIILKAKNSLSKSPV